jgi:hypothetical protein
MLSFLPFSYFFTSFLSSYTIKSFLCGMEMLWGEPGQVQSRCSPNVRQYKIWRSGRHGPRNYSVLHGSVEH